MNITIVPVGMLGTNCYLLESDAKSCAVIDPGDQPDKIIDILAEKGLTPRMILLTHGHHDHIGGVNRLRARFPEAALYVGAEDQVLLQDTDKSRAIFRSKRPEEYIINDAVSLQDGQELPLDELTIRVLETPGHTRGGLTYLCRDAMFSGDTLFAGDCGRCDLYGGDYAVMLESLKKLAGLEGDYVVYPGHGESSTLSQERKSNRYMIEGCS